VQDGQDAAFKSIEQLLLHLDQVVDPDPVCLLINAFTFFDRRNCILGPPNVLYLSMQENDLNQGFSREGFGQIGFYKGHVHETLQFLDVLLGVTI
jgi:hypothetical protein